MMSSKVGSHGRRTVVKIGLWALMLHSLAGCRTQVDESMPARAVEAEADLTPAQKLSGLFYGESQGPGGRRAWFIRITRANGAAFVYDAPGLTGLCSVARAKPGVSRWQAHLGASGALHEFYVVSTASALPEWFVVSSVPRRDSVELRLRPVTHAPTRSRREGAVRSGIYSSLQTHEMSGDLVGQELILAETETGPVGALVIAEGGASLPYALQEIRAVNDTLRFTVNMEGIPLHYLVVFQQTSATIRPGDGGEPEILPLRKGVAEYFEGSLVRDCKVE